MNLKDAVQFIRESNGKIFSIKFRKRTNNEIREMVCRQGVKKDLVETPSRPPVNFKAHGLIPVYDMQKQAYRSIPIEGILEIKIEGVWVKIEKD